MLIYIIDDNDITLTIYENIVRSISQDIEVLTFQDPIMAFTSCLQKMPDIILVDYSMPCINGHDFVRKIKEMPNSDGLPILMITSDTDLTVRHTALTIGVTDFITKPVNTTEFKARLNNLIVMRKYHITLNNNNEILRTKINTAMEVIKKRDMELITRLSKAAEYRDPETGDHILRMAEYSRIIAEQMGLDAYQCDLIYTASPMHDIGKLGIPDAILLKNGRLTEDEFAIMKRHSQIGYDILSSSGIELLRIGGEIALSHHEKWDGSGYPNGRVGMEIPLHARIAAIADIFDALTSHRVYKRKWSLDEAREYLVGQRERHFDPACLDAFFNAWDKVLNIYQSHNKTM